MKFIIKIVLRLTLAALCLLFVALLVLAVGAHFSLDHERQYTAATEALPDFSPTSSPDGLTLIKAGDYRYRARVAGFEGTGSQSRPGVILLHGFPVSSAMWDPLIGPLAAAGYRVVAFDQRGYSPLARPGDVADYSIDELYSDVLKVADAAGMERFHLVGHDWGAGVGWATVLNSPQRVISWTALSIAHPAAFAEAAENDPDQRSRSSYFLFFATPWLPQNAFVFNDLSMLRGLYEPMPASEKDEYLRLFSEPGAMRAALGWYRAAMSQQGQTGIGDNTVSVPTRFIWGNQDVAVGRRATETQTQYMAGPFEVLEYDAGHWLMEELPLQTSAAIMEHILSY